MVSTTALALFLRSGYDNMTKHLFITDPHADPAVLNKRALWAGELIADEQPDVVVMGGDLHEMNSLSAYDRGKARFVGKSYKGDIAAGVEFNDMMWGRVKRRKKRLPRRVAMEGNHEHRIATAINLQPELDGVISLKDLDWEKYYDDIVWYDGNTPGVIAIDGVHYAHFMVSGVMGRAISGEHPAYSLLTKRFHSCSVGHLHLFDHCVRTRGDGKKMQGLVAGCYFDHYQGWAGQANGLYWSGICIKDGVEDGNYDLRMISMKQLEKEYGYLT